MAPKKESLVEDPEEEEHEIGGEDPTDFEAAGSEPEKEEFEPEPAPEPALEPGPEPEPESPPQQQEPQRRGRPRKITIPEGTVNLQLVQGAKKPAPQPKKQTAWTQARVQASESWERDAARISETTTWTLERTAPHYYGGKRVPNGLFPDEFQGPVTAPVLGEIGGGGTYWVTFVDPITGDSRRLGPIKIAGAPRFDIGIQEEEEESKPPADFTAGAYFNRDGSSDEKKEDRWIEVHDPKLGRVMRRESDIERDMRNFMFGNVAQAPAESAKVTELEKKLDKLADMILQQSASPKEDTALQWMQIEKERIAAEKDQKAKELQYMRDKLDAELKEAQKRREDELKLFEKKLDAERDRAKEEREELRERLEADRQAAEKRLEADKERLLEDRRQAQEQLTKLAEISDQKMEKAQETMLAMVKEKSSPTDQLTGLLTTVSEVAGLLGYTPPGGGGDEKEGGLTPQLTGIDKLIALGRAAGARVWPTIEGPLKAYLDKTVSQMAAASIQAQQTQVQVQQLPAPTPPPSQSPKAAPSPQPQAPREPTLEEQAVQIEAIGEIMEEINSAMDRNLPPSVTWGNVISGQPELAKLLKGYANVEAMVAEMQLMTLTPQFSKYAPTIMKIAEKASGSKKQWAEEFLGCARRWKG